jgi:hypothetical protein
LETLAISICPKLSSIAYFYPLHHSLIIHHVQGAQILPFFQPDLQNLPQTIKKLQLATLLA